MVVGGIDHELNSSEQGGFRATKGVISNLKVEGRIPSDVERYQ